MRTLSVFLTRASAQIVPVLSAAALAFGVGLVGAGPAHADKIKNPTAVFAGLDKITGRIISFEVAIDETVQFGALQLTPRLCYTRPPTEPQNTTAFIEVDEVTFSNEYRRIFGGWIFASSPGLHGIEHPIYDVWLTTCKGGTVVIPDPVEPGRVAEPAQPQDPRQARRQNTDILANPPGLPPVPGGQIGVQAPVGVPVAPRQPSQRYFPTRQPGLYVVPENPNR